MLKTVKNQNGEKNTWDMVKIKLGLAKRPSLSAWVTVGNNTELCKKSTNFEECGGSLTVGLGEVGNSWGYCDVHISGFGDWVVSEAIYRTMEYGDSAKFESIKQDPILNILSLRH